jgi:PTS system nitrogen regulatory IIA component
MDLKDLIGPDAVYPALKARDKKQALSELAERAGQLARLSSRDIFEKLVQRERLGSTGVGRGIAIPHLRLAELGHMTCLFARFETPVEFESPDGEPVDLAFLLLTPEHAGADHLKALARISRVMRQPRNTEQLRAAPDRRAIHAILTQPDLALAG